MNKEKDYYRRATKAIQLRRSRELTIDWTMNFFKEWDEVCYKLREGRERN